MIVSRKYAGTVKFGYRRDDAQSQAVSARGPALFQTIEALENAHGILRWHAPAIVGDAEFDAAIGLGDRDGDLGGSGRVGIGVLEKIGEGQRQQLRIAIDPDIGRDVLLEAPALLFQGWRECLADVGHQPAQAKTLKAGASAAALNLSDAQKRSEHFQYGVELPNPFVEHSAIGFARKMPMPGRIQQLPQAAKRRSQIMSNIVGEVLQAFHQAGGTI